jgi:DNA-binding transcriptional LysR family regulator
MRTTHFMTLPSILTASEMIATVPAGFGTEFATSGKIVAVPQPFDIPRYRVCQFWHRRFDKDPRMIWLRTLTANLFGPGSDFAATLSRH